MKRNHNLLNAALVVVMLVSLLLTAGPAASQGQTKPYPDLDIALIFDESGSMYAFSDVDLWRFKAANLLIDLFGLDQSGSQHQMSVVMFGYPKVDKIIELTPLDNGSKSQSIRDAITKNALNRNGTNIPKALLAAQEQLGKARANSKKAVIIISDGRCEVPSSESANCDQDIRKIITAANWKYPVYAVALAEASKQDDLFKLYKNVWMEMSTKTGGLYEEVGDAATGLNDAILRIHRHLLGLPTILPTITIAANTEKEITVPNNLLEVIFTLVKSSSGVGSNIKAPDGKDLADGGNVRISKSDNADTYSIKEPTGGVYKVRINGPGSVRVDFIEKPKVLYKVSKVFPQGAVPAGKPLDMTVQIVDNNLNTTTADDLKAAVILAGKDLGAVAFAAAGGNQYKGSLANTSAPGTYQFRFTSKPLANGLALNDEIKVDVIKAPWLDVTAPKDGTTFLPGQAIKVEAQLMELNQPKAAPDAGQTLTASIKVNADSFAMTGSGGKYTRELTNLSAGSYKLVVALRVALASGEEVTSETELNIKVAAPATTTVTPTLTRTPTATNTPVPVIVTTTVGPSKTPTITPTTTPPPEPPSPGAIAGGVLGLLALLAAGVAGFWYWSKPGLTGTVFFDEMPYPLKGKSSLWIGSDPRRNKFVVMEENILPRHAEFRPVGTNKRPQVELRSVDMNFPVRVNGAETAYAVLNDGDVIQVGSKTINYSGPVYYSPDDATMQM